MDQPPAFAGTGLLRRAWEFAADAHRGQRRKGSEAPYIVHPNAVAALTREHDGDEEMIAAAFLHDVIEDTETVAAGIYAEFGSDVGSLVVALSDDRNISDYEQRKSVLRRQVESAGSRAILIYAADKVANSTGLRQVLAEGGQEAAERHGVPVEVRLRIWRQDLEMARRRLGSVPLLGELGEALDALENARPAAA